MEKEKEKKVEVKKSSALVTILIIALLITTSLCGYFVGAYKFTTSIIKDQKEVNEKSVTEEETTEPEETTKEEVKSPYRTCTGTYKGTGPISMDVQTKETENGEYKLELKADGSFEFKAGFTENGGNYVIKENTLVLLSLKHTYGPEDEDPIITTSTYVISKDCSKVTFDSVVTKDTVVLNKQ